MRKIVSIISVLMLLVGSGLHISSCTEEVNPLEGFQMPTEADTNSRYLVCEIDGRLFFARGKYKKGSLGGGADVVLQSIGTISGYSPNRENNPIRTLRVSEDFEVNNETFSEGISFNFWPNLKRDSIFAQTIIPLGKANGEETPICSAGFFRLVNKDDEHLKSLPYTETNGIERGELKLSTVGKFKGLPIYHGTFWFDIKNPNTGEIIKIRNGRFNHNLSTFFPDKFQNGTNTVAY